MNSGLNFFSSPIFSFSVFSNRNRENNTLILDCFGSSTHRHMLTLPPSDDPHANSAVSSGTADFERRVMEAVKESEARGDPPLLRAVEVARCCVSDEKEGLVVGFPNAELASILVSNLCFSHNSPSMWKLLDQAMASRLVYPCHILALLTPR